MQPLEGIHEKQELLFIFSLEGLGKTAADCCVQGSSDRARALFLLKQDNSRSREGRGRNETPDRVLLSKSSRIRIGQPQILVYVFLFTSLQSCFSGYFLYTGKAESHDMPDFAWHELTHLSVNRLPAKIKTVLHRNQLFPTASPDDVVLRSAKVKDFFVNGL